MNKLARLEVVKDYDDYGMGVSYDIKDNLTGEKFNLMFRTKEEAEKAINQLEYLANTNYLGEGSYSKFKLNAQLLNQ